MENYQKIIQKTREDKILSADPGELIVMLYDGAIESMLQAVDAFQQNRQDEAIVCINKAQRIMYELEGSLDMSTGEIAKNLSSLYEYSSQCLSDAFMKKKAVFIQPALKVFRELRSAWVKALEQAPKTNNNNAGADCSLFSVAC